MVFENVTYFLGAGFSAPLGLPVTSNFIEKSKDLYALHPESLLHFSQIYKTLDEISKIKNYFHADLFNIEEVLSILEMSTTLDGTSEADKFKKFIIDVINHYTPKIDVQISDFHMNKLLQDYTLRPQSLYAIFLLAACNLTVDADHTRAEDLTHFH